MTKTKISTAILTGLCALTLSATGCDSAKDAKKAAPADKKSEAKAGDKKAGGDVKAAAGDKKPEGGADKAAEAPKVEKIDIATLKVEAEGWEGEFNKALESWTFEKYTPAGDGTNSPNRFYVDFLPDDAPKDVEEYAKKLQEDENFQDYGFKYTAVDRKAAIDGGWVIVGTVKDMSDDEDKGEPGFVLYRASKNLYCRGGTFVDEKLRDEAIKACEGL